MKLYHWFIIFVTTFFLNAGVFAESSLSSPVYAEDKTSILVSADHPEFIIKLKSNPTTGYSWFLSDYNSSLVEPVKHVFEAPADKKIVGAPGFELWTFRIKSSGFVVPHQTLIRLVYTRPWENLDKGEVITYRVTITSATSTSHSQKSR